ncbi:MAG: hypothetical protein KDD73_15810 [Anaerolineales bacterium]|nr:hypothetical protein [Anaerolineales bacterium]
MTNSHRLPLGFALLGTVIPWRFFAGFSLNKAWIVRCSRGACSSMGRQGDSAQSR